MEIINSPGRSSLLLYTIYIKDCEEQFQHFLTPFWCCCWCRRCFCCLLIYLRYFRLDFACTLLSFSCLFLLFSHFPFRSFISFHSFCRSLSFPQFDSVRMIFTSSFIFTFIHWARWSSRHRLFFLPRRSFDVRNVVAVLKLQRCFFIG